MLQERLLKELRETAKVLSDYIAGGGPAKFEDYREEVGRLAGINQAISLIIDESAKEEVEED